jgi:hypothetical protein
MIKKNGEKRRFTISELSFVFPQSSHTHEIITLRLGYHKFCKKWFPKMLTAAPKMQRIASAFTF